MKKACVIILLSVLFVLPACTETVDIDAEKAKVKSVIDKMMTGMETKDMDLFSSIFSHEKDMVNFGTDAAERWVGWEILEESLRKQFESYENSKITVSNEVIKVNKSAAAAWFSIIIDWNLTAKGETVSINGMRMTGVLEKRDNNWVFVQFHASVPVTGQAMEY